MELLQNYVTCYFRPDEKLTKMSATSIVPEGAGDRMKEFQAITSTDDATALRYMQVLVLVHTCLLFHQKKKEILSSYAIPGKV